TVLMLAVAAALLLPLLGALRPRLQERIEPRTVFLAASISPVALWLLFVVWRDVIVPPLSHDALSYHLPKALLFVRAAGYRTFEDMSFLFAPRGSNYELLLADAIAGDATDAYTEWPAALFYAGFVLCAVAMAQRWFRTGAAALVTMALLIAATPVLLLHSGAHKNDLLFALFAAGAMLAAGRWFAERDVRSLALAVCSFVALTGTKSHGAVLTLAFVPLILTPMFRPFRAKALGIAAMSAIVATLFLGGFEQLARLQPKQPAPQASASAEGGASRTYGDWENLWQAPYILVAAPFSRSASSLRVPWDSTPWFWRRHELFFSHLGAAFSLAALALPFLLIALRNRPGSPRERVAVTIAALLAFLVLLPVHFVPAGLYSLYLPRFVLFLLPVVFAWVVPVVDAAANRRAALGAACVAAGVVVFGIQAIEAAVDDDFVPFDYVLWARANPETRSIPFTPNRVASVVDRIAGPRDRIVFDAGQGAWIYPAYGKELQREVGFIPPGPGVPHIPDADWIVIDRLFSAVWSNPNFKSLGAGEKYMAKSVTTAEDARVINALRNDPRYEAISIRPRTKQAIFRRRR
ncbi:MAG: hypothetical protein WA208_01625, partial [Thermoanaerobaculia bacterium]